MAIQFNGSPEDRAAYQSLLESQFVVFENRGEYWVQRVINGKAYSLVDGAHPGDVSRDRALAFRRESIAKEVALYDRMERD